MKIIAFYLPQFHPIKENNIWWGENFTEWVNVKAAKALFNGHYQPRVPLSSKYYNLTDIDALIWQAELAKKYGIYGFCYYHYWFNGKLLLEKPAEIMLHDKRVDLPFCFSWANESWTRIWSGNKKKILIKQIYGNRDNWENHFNYLLKFFRDERYIKLEGKPLFIIYRPELIKSINNMMLLWQELAIKSGLPGISFTYQYVNYNHRNSQSGNLFDYGIEYQPAYSMNNDLIKIKKDLKRRFALNIKLILNNYLNIKNLSNIIKFDYDYLWDNILTSVPKDKKMIPGAFVDWDSTPRRKAFGSVCQNVNPEHFSNYLSQQIKRAKNVYKKDMIFLFAWNEWGEGGYLEPDERYKFQMLEGVRQALLENNELD